MQNRMKNEHTSEIGLRQRFEFLVCVSANSNQGNLCLSSLPTIQVYLPMPKKLDGNLAPEN